MSETNKALVRRVFDELFNKHTMTAFDELYSGDCVYRAPRTELRGVAYRQYLAAVFAAFPGQWRIEDQMAEGEKVVTRWTFTGTHQAEFVGFAPTGRLVTGSGIVIARIVDGKIAEEWEEWDALGLIQQLGAASPAGKAEEKAVG